MQRSRCLGRRLRAGELIYCVDDAGDRAKLSVESDILRAWPLFRALQGQHLLHRLASRRPGSGSPAD
jgi:hypothetical protein